MAQIINYLPLLGILLLCMYVFLFYPQRVYVADAGPTKELTAWQQLIKNYLMPYQYVQIAKGVYVNSRDYIRVLVDGKCMGPKGIKDKSQVLVEPLHKDEDFKSQVNLEDVLLIRLPDKKVYKLRILQEYTSDNKLVTYRYEKGEKHMSSRTHSTDDVIGVVRYAVQK